LPGRYVGSIEGVAVGPLDGEHEGNGVGRPAINVGDSVGCSVGLLEGVAVSTGVDFPGK